MTSPTGYFFDLVYSGGRLSQIIDSTGRVTDVIIDANGDLVSATLPDGAARTFEYDAQHLLVAQTGARGERSEYDYQTGRIVENRAFDVDGTTLLRRRQFSPSVLNGEISEALQSGLGSLINPIPVVADRVDVYVDGRGQTWLNETDDRGNTIRHEDPLGRATTMAYDANNLRTSRTRPNGSITEFEYDAFGNLTVQRELFNGAITRFEYLGPFQRVSKVTDPRGNETSFAYFPNGSLSQITDALSNTTSFLYENPSFPNLVTTTRDSLNNNIAVSYDKRGSVVSLTDPLDRTTSFEYDERGNRRAVTDGRAER
ncbi:MAG: RHS repeat protein, partial [Planctomycetes bacterium]|nr:RHS repeat protein [Planctomycetota bacterium]